MWRVVTRHEAVTENMDTPVALIVFNRPDLTERVFAEARRARPSTLLLIADGPRAAQPTDVKKCAETRAIVERVDWPCEVLKNYSDVNLGCGLRESSGMTWIFEQVEEAIVLEDDTLPHPSFFPFCEAMLDRYRHDERVMHISGDNWLVGGEAPGAGGAPDGWILAAMAALELGRTGDLGAFVSRASEALAAREPLAPHRRWYLEELAGGLAAA